MAHRYFTQDIKDGMAAITGPDAAHLARVLRVQPGEKLLLCDGQGLDFDAEVVQVAPQEILLAVLASRPTSAEPDLWAEMYIGYAKGDKMEWAVQKCVELGASRIIPFFSSNTVVKPGNEQNKNQRYNRIAAEAAKQSGRGILPLVEMPLDFNAAVGQAVQTGCALFLYECGGTALPKALGGAKRVAFITGAEGGFTPAEAEIAKQAGCVAVGLGPRILRCETAPVAALAAAMALSGNLE